MIKPVFNSLVSASHGVCVKVQSSHYASGPAPFSQTPSVFIPENAIPSRLPDLRPVLLQVAAMFLKADHDWMSEVGKRS